jgi:putative acetyltransferase
LQSLDVSASCLVIGNSMIIRDEIAEDIALIHIVVTEAFRTAPTRPGELRGRGGTAEANIVDILRASGALTLSLVAIEDGDLLVGHVAFSPVSIDGRDLAWFGMGPVAVWPERQGGGVGSKLVSAGLERMQKRGAQGIVVLGDPAYYSRFGFRAHAGLRYPGPPASHFKALSFGSAVPSGIVKYHSAFEAAG